MREAHIHDWIPHNRNLNPSSRYLAINKEEYKQRVCDALGSSFGFLVWVCDACHYCPIGSICYRCRVFE